MAARRPLAAQCTGVFDTLKPLVKNIDERDLSFLGEEEFVEQLSATEAGTRPLLRLFFRQSCPVDPEAPPYEDRVFMCKDQWQVIDFSSVFLPAFAPSAPTIESLADVLQHLVAAGRIANTRTCLNLSTSRLGDSDVAFIAKGVEVLATACPEVCVVLRLTRLTAAMPLQSLLEIPQLKTIDMCSTAFATIDACSVLATLLPSDAARLILVPNMSILGTALPALFSRNKAHLQASYRAHELYYNSHTPILRERLWIYERQDRAQRNLALAVKDLIASQRQREKTAAEDRDENIRRLIRQEQRREERRELELTRARFQRDMAVGAVVAGVVAASVAGLWGLVRKL